MAGMNISVDKEQFCCSVCLDVLWEPVTIPCGHSYCMECIKGYWRKCELKEEYSCPQCRRTFSPKPVLCRNTMLADVVEKLRRTDIQDAGRKAADVECDVCTGKKHRAVRFCVKCQMFYCETHLKPHNERNRGRMHPLTERSAQAVEDDSEKIFTRLQRSVERKHLEVKELIRGEERTALSQTEKLLERLNQQTVEHRRGEAELEALSNTEDHFHFLQVKSWIQTQPTLSSAFLETVQRSRPTMSHSHHFISWAQVLCKEGQSGCGYWEVEWRGGGGVSIGVSYKTGGTMDQKLGCNSKSWSLDFADFLSLFQHNKFSVEIHTPMHHRVGVYLDHRAGMLAFYCISLADDTMILLHREQTTFTQPLYPGFWVGLGSTLKLCRTFSLLIPSQSVLNYLLQLL
uniref:FinTRIM family, member 87 n=1 Tax=Sinocyclocheilus rhinocerous TaxID=307959 RepID=A0A673IIG1_9TELE